MATPLYLVALHAHGKKQRRQAIGIFEDWKKGSMAGISALALETIYQRQAWDFSETTFDFGVKDMPARDLASIQIIDIPQVVETSL